MENQEIPENMSPEEIVELGGPFFDLTLRADRMSVTKMVSLEEAEVLRDDLTTIINEAKEKFNVE